MAPPINPMVGIFCCARAANGHAATLPSAAMISLRPIFVAIAASARGMIGKSIPQWWHAASSDGVMSSSVHIALQALLTPWDNILIYKAERGFIERAAAFYDCRDVLVPVRQSAPRTAFPKRDFMRYHAFFNLRLSLVGGALRRQYDFFISRLRRRWTLLHNAARQAMWKHLSHLGCTTIQIPNKDYCEVTLPRIPIREGIAK